MRRSHFEGTIGQIVLGKNDRLASIILVFLEDLKQISPSHFRAVLVLEMWGHEATQTASAYLLDYALAYLGQGAEQTTKHHTATGTRNPGANMTANRQSQ